MEAKLIEIRDRMTCISAVVLEVAMSPKLSGKELWLLGKMGWGPGQSGYYLMAEHPIRLFGPAIVHSEEHRAMLQSGALHATMGEGAERFWNEAGFIHGADGDTLQRDYCVPLLFAAAYWPTIASGHLIDVRVILGEESAPCESDYHAERGQP